MAKKSRTAITPTREENYPEWYQQVIREADLAENSPVRGCMVIKPWGFGLWENIQSVLDGEFKATGHKNAYFPLFIPLSYMEREAAHVEGFAKECAVVTHHRLEARPEGGLQPAGPLEEPLIVRPTSETIIGEMFARWVQSYRDLPLLINQWANVVRWEMRTRLFLRTTEFLWQEGHTAHATEAEAMEETLRMLEVYAEFVENFMAIPVVKGEKTASERFPGAVATYSIEAMMQDRKALQAGTSHFLGQNFSHAANIKFLDTEGAEQFAWTTSWGVSTRLIGALVMAHSDDNGLVLPPRLAPAQLVILPVVHDDATKSEVINYCMELADDLKALQYHRKPLQVEVDLRDERGGTKFWSWVKRGVPLRLEIGNREMKSGLLSLSRRDRDNRERDEISRDNLLSGITSMLDEMQKTIFDRARNFREDNTRMIDSKEAFYEFFRGGDGKKSEAEGFVLSHWNGSTDVEEQIKAELGVTIRCIPMDSEDTPGKCIFTGEASPRRVLFAKAY